MNSDIEKEVEQIAEAVVDINEEIELASEEGTPLEDIEGAKTLAAGLLEKYNSLLKRLSSDERMEVQRRIGLVVERMKGKLVQLKEAPE